MIIEGVEAVLLQIHADDRGRMLETYRHEWLPHTAPMVQSNHAVRHAGCVVGLHYHLRQADYWYVASGRARAVLHDLRVGSPTEGTTQVVELAGAGDDGPTPKGLYIPPGVAHGFAALSDLSLTYLVDAYYDPADEHGLAWNDPAVTADWGIADPRLSTRDLSNPGREAIDPLVLPRYARGKR